MFNYSFFLVSEENLEIICDLDGVGLLIETIKTHGKNSKVVKNACLALASLVEIDGMILLLHFLYFLLFYTYC
jgi:hypothetical protein